MKRLMFPLAGCTLLALLSGCGTPTGPWKNSDGSVLTTATGHGICVVSDSEELKPLPKFEIAANATYEQRLKARVDYLAKASVQIHRSDVEIVKKIKESVFVSIKEEVTQLVSQRKFKVLHNSVIVHIEGRPQIAVKYVKRYATSALEPGQVVTDGMIVALQAVLEKELTAFLENEYYPKMAAFLMDALRPRVMDSVAKGEFARARNLIWVASRTGIPFVDNKVRREALDLMHGIVNPSNWKEIEPKIEQVYKTALETKKYDEGIKNLHAIEQDLLVKEYADLIDKRLDAIREELKRLNVPEADMKPILEKQGALISAAANIKDVCDEYLTLEGAKSERREIEARKEPELAEYYKRLDDFRDTLISFNCTKENADRITIELDRDLIALINLLRRSAVYADSEKEGKKSLQLGTASLNLRIHKMVVDRCEKLFKGKLDDTKKAFGAKIGGLVAAGEFEEAREAIWNSSITGNKAWDEEMFAFGLKLLRDVVNPKDWARIEADIRANFKELSEKGDFEKLTKFLKEYPLIRQHTVKLDEQLARVRAEAEALGADPKAAEEAARTACGMVTEAEALVDHLDTLVADAVKDGQPLDKSKLKKELEIYAKKLAAYHATPENVTAIVKKLQDTLEGLILEPKNPAATHLVLGTNAVNDRIKKLVAELLASIAKTKHTWENEEHARLTTDLEKRVRAAVKEQRFDDARNYIRDEKLIGRQDLDLSLYVLRVGLLDSCVNPNQLDFLLSKIDEKIAEFQEAKDYKGILEYIENYPYVHDQYEEVDKALAAVKTAMLALEISKVECEKDEKQRFFLSIQELLEKRRESWKPERDLSGVEKALTEVAKALFAHLNKHPELIEAEKKEEYLHILEDIAALDRTITTWEMNEQLRRHLMKYMPEAKTGLEAQEYAKLVGELDNEISFDSQVAMAEDAIAKQLGINCPEAHLKMNAVLGEYARVMRLLKLGQKLTNAQTTTMLIGGIYLNQPAVVAHALKLGGDVNAFSDRDPLQRTPLLVAIQTGHNAFLKQLADANAKFVVADAKGDTTLHYAVRRGNLSVVKAMLKSNDVNKANAAGETPIFIAVRRNQEPVVSALIAANADVKVENALKLTPFDTACQVGSSDVLDVLAKAGAKYGPLQLAIAARFDHVGVAQWLVGRGVDVNASGVMGAVKPSSATHRYLLHEGGVDVVLPLQQEVPADKSSK